jgi:hypothetical protein
MERLGPIQIDAMQRIGGRSNQSNCILLAGELKVVLSSDVLLPLRGGGDAKN